jgi:hypothetical protein
MRGWLCALLLCSLAFAQEPSPGPDFSRAARERGSFYLNGINYQYLQGTKYTVVASAIPTLNEKYFAVKRHVLNRGRSSVNMAPESVTVDDSVGTGPLELLAADVADMRRQDRLGRGWRQPLWGPSRNGAGWLRGCSDYGRFGARVDQGVGGQWIPQRSGAAISHPDGAGISTGRSARLGVMRSGDASCVTVKLETGRRRNCPRATRGPSTIPPKGRRAGRAVFLHTEAHRPHADFAHRQEKLPCHSDGSGGRGKGRVRVSAGIVRTGHRKDSYTVRASSRIGRVFPGQVADTDLSLGASKVAPSLKLLFMPDALRNRLAALLMRKPSKRTLWIIAIVLLCLWGSFLTFIGWAMRQPPEKFGRVMSRMPMPAFFLFPFETMWTHARAGTVTPGEMAPDFRLPTLDHQSEVHLSALRGKPVVLVFGSYT